MRRQLWLLLLSGLLLRLFLSPFGTHQLDFNTYLAWSNRLIETGFSNFYQIWSDYLPGYLYILWLLGKLKLLLPFLPTVTLYKFPAILADIFSAYLIFKLVAKRYSVGASSAYPLVAISAAAAYLFNPAIFANSTLWGQTDSLIALAALLWFAWLPRHSVLAGLALGIGALIKPSLGLIAPLTLIFAPRPRFKHTAIVAAISGLIFAAGFLPFAAGQPLFEFIISRLSVSLNQYPYTSLHSFNLWQILDGYWQSDLNVFLGLPKQAWGQFLFAAFSLLAVWRFSRSPHSPAHRSLLVALVFFNSFLFLTRIHERHLLLTLPFLTVAAALKPWLLPIYLWLNLSYLLGLLYSYVAVTSSYQNLIFTSPVMAIFSLLNLAALVWLLLPRFPQIKTHHLILAAIILFAFITRVTRLHLPSDFYFDEVYHAVTAQAYARNDPAGYEWWHPAPQPGTAYEWLHPPLAKLIQAGSIQLFGDSSFSWRFPGVIFGTLAVYLVYLLAKELFPRSKFSIPLLAAALFALDGLNFVQSRITMNDIFLTVFVLAAVIAFIKFKRGYAKSALVLTSLFIGLSISTKWTGIYLLPVFAVIELLSFRISNLFRYFFAFLIIPAAIYLLSYSQFWLQGHTWAQFVELHRQTWLYQTRLDATHPYQSAAWTWPLNLRPVWYYVDYQDNTVANIYALGNPAIFWAGLLAVIYTLALIILRRIPFRSPCVILTTCYLLLFLPWLFSPRIMFLYHYLPATPFMVILLAWVLTRIGFKFAICYWLLAIGLFLFFYPHWTAIPVPKDWANLYFWLPTWK